MPTVSVIIPTYDRAEVLPRAVESVLEQTYEDFELLVVDDGSSDDTEEYLESVDDERLRPIYHETNQGCNAARNTGVEAAAGEYVAFLDSDDEWKPRMLERAIDRVKSVPEAVAVYCDTEQLVDSPFAPVISVVASLLAHTDPDRPKEGGEELTREMLIDTIHTGAGSTLLAEKAVVREVGGFDEEFRYFRDPEFMLRLVQGGHLAYVDEPLVIRHMTGAPDADRIEHYAEMLLEKHEGLVEEWEAKGYDVRGAHALILAKAFLAEGKFGRAAPYLAESSIRARQVPGICWRAGAGLGQRTNGPLVPAVAVVAVLGLLAVAWLAIGSNHSA